MKYSRAAQRKMQHKQKQTNRGANLPQDVPSSSRRALADAKRRQVQRLTRRHCHALQSECHYASNLHCVAGSQPGSRDRLARSLDRWIAAGRVCCCAYEAQQVNTMTGGICQVFFLFLVIFLPAAVENFLICWPESSVKGCRWARVKVPAPCDVERWAIKRWVIDKSQGKSQHKHTLEIRGQAGVLPFLL